MILTLSSISVLIKMNKIWNHTKLALSKFKIIFPPYLALEFFGSSLETIVDLLEVVGFFADEEKIMGFDFTTEQFSSRFLGKFIDQSQGIGADPFFHCFSIVFTIEFGAAFVELKWKIELGPWDPGGPGPARVPIIKIAYLFQQQHSIAIHFVFFVNFIFRCNGKWNIIHGRGNFQKCLSFLAIIFLKKLKSCILT